MINIHINSKDYGSGLLLQGVKLRLDRGKRYGLLGPNGCGKSTLLKIIAQEDLDFSGFIQPDPELRLSYVSQEPEFDSQVDTISWLCSKAIELRTKLRAVEQDMANPLLVGTMEKLLERYQNLLDAYQEVGGDDAEDQALRLLARVGLEDRAFTPASRLSGGEQGRLRIMAALEQRPDVLLLDEPGNHLDLWGLAWLEDVLESFKGILIMVSHDRRLLESTCGYTLSMYGSALEEFHGTYSGWRINRIQRAASQGMGWQADRQHIARLEEVVRRFQEFARNTKDPAWGARLQAKRTQLAHAQERATQRPRLEQQPVDIQFQSQQAPSHTALELRGWKVSRGDRTLIQDARLFIASGERVALVGRNGSGKTSLIDDILVNGNWDHREIRLGPSQKLACIAQNRKGYDLNQTILEHLLLLSPCRREEVISFLRPYRFLAGDLDKPLGDLSGGEWNLFQLARAARFGANFLILDEPTNHLDLDARENLEQALEEFSGTLLVVSHDRWFLDSVCQRVVEIREARLWDEGLSPQEFLTSVAQEAGQGDYYSATQTERELRTQERQAEQAIREGRWADAKKQGITMAKEAKKLRG